MNRPDKAGEPSMEEILASIRQIIADDPIADLPEPGIAANPLVPQSSAPKPVTEARVPLADRLSGVLKNGSLPPTSPLGSKRPLPFDQDLADMFDEPAESNGSAVAAPKPVEFRVPPPGAEPSRAPSLDGAFALPPQFAEPQPFVPPPPFGGAETTTEKVADVAPPTTFGFPPLRKASFYPPQPKATAAPYPAAPAAPYSAALEPLASSPEVPLSAAAPASDPATLRGEAAFRMLGVGGIQEPAASPLPVSQQPVSQQPVSQQPFAQHPFAPQSASPEAASPFPAAPLPSAFNPFSEAPIAPVPPAGSSEPTPYDDSLLSDAPFATAAPPYSPAPVNQPSPFAAFEQRPVDPPIDPKPYDFAVKTRPSSAYEANPSPFAAAPELSSAAAHNALDALAQGLAASAASHGMAEAVSPAVPLTRVIDVVEQAPASAPLPSMLPATFAGGEQSPANRTLEDAVADMLRPMLQQWVADNMPRIIERALRSEVATSVKPGQKPRGS